MTWDGSSYDPNKYGEQIITGQLDVEGSFYEDELEPTSTVKAIARITLIGDEPIVPTLDPPTYSRQIYSGDFASSPFPTSIFPAEKPRQMAKRFPACSL